MLDIDNTKNENYFNKKSNYVLYKDIRLLDTSNFIKPINYEHLYYGKCSCDSEFVEKYKNIDLMKK